MRNMFCLVFTSLGGWGVYWFLNSSFDIGFGIGMGACALVIAASFAYAAHYDRNNPVS